MIEFDTHDVLCLVSSIVWYLVCFVIEFDTHDVLCLVSSIALILDMFYVTFQGYGLGVFMVSVYKAPVSLTKWI